MGLVKGNYVIGWIAAIRPEMAAGFPRVFFERHGASCDRRGGPWRNSLIGLASASLGSERAIVACLAGALQLRPGSWDCKGARNRKVRIAHSTTLRNGTPTDRRR